MEGHLCLEGPQDTTAPRAFLLPCWQPPTAAAQPSGQDQGEEAGNQAGWHLCRRHLGSSHLKIQQVDALFAALAYLECKMGLILLPCLPGLCQRYRCHQRLVSASEQQEGLAHPLTHTC